MAPPMKVTEFSILYGKGIDEHGCVLDVALEAGILTQKGAWIYYEGELFSQGRENAINQLRENEEVFNSIKEKIKSISH
jgi:recombination protein RecA